LQLEELKASLLEKQIVFTWTSESPKALADMAIGGTRGARDLRNAMRRRVEDPITTQIVQAIDAKLSRLMLSEEDGDVVVTGM